MSAAAIIAIILVGVVVLLAVTRGDKGGDIAIPEVPQRAGLLNGYYGCYGDQVAQTKGHTNLHWEPFWSGVEAAIVNLHAANCAAVIDVDAFLFAPASVPRAFQPNAESNLRDLFNRLQSGGVLHLVRFIVPCDEPNLTKDGTIDLMPEAVALIRRVAADYPSLSGVRLGVIYATNRTMQHIELFDVVGFDDYDKRSSIFAPGGIYEQMRAQLRPEQRTWIVPGACYGQDPAPFLNFANANPEVLAIVAFLWATVPWEDSFKGIVEQPEIQAKYEAMGKLIVGAHA